MHAEVVVHASDLMGVARPLMGGPGEEEIVCEILYSGAYDGLRIQIVSDVHLEFSADDAVPTLLDVLETRIEPPATVAAWDSAVASLEVPIRLLSPTTAGEPTAVELR